MVFFVVPLDRLLLKDLDFLPWPDTTGFKDIFGMSVTDPGLTSFESPADETFYDATVSTDDASANMLHSPEVSSNDMFGGTYEISHVRPVTGIKQEREESELMKLLLKKTKDSTESVVKPANCHSTAVKPILPEPPRTLVPQTMTQTVPVQPVFSTSTPKLVISQPTQTVQICSIYQRPIEENRSPEALLTIPG